MGNGWQTMMGCLSEQFVHIIHKLPKTVFPPPLWAHIAPGLALLRSLCTLNCELRPPSAVGACHCIRRTAASQTPREGGSGLGPREERFVIPRAVAAVEGWCAHDVWGHCHRAAPGAEAVAAAPHPTVQCKCSVVRPQCHIPRTAHPTYAVMMMIMLVMI